MKLSQNTCEYCDKPAVWHVLAQWSLFDFDDDLTCQEHTHYAIINFARKWVDEEPIRELLVEFCGPRSDD